MKYPTIEIKKPCEVKLESSSNKGKYCRVCETFVVDFTNKTPDEISMYLKNNKNNKVCGTFNSWDLKSDRTIDRLILYFNNKKLKLVSLFMIGFVVLSGCRVRYRGAPSYAQDPRTLNDNTTDTISRKK